MRGGKNHGTVTYKSRKKVAERDERGKLTGRSVYLVTRRGERGRQSTAPVSFGVK